MGAPIQETNPLENGFKKDLNTLTKKSSPKPLSGTAKKSNLVDSSLSAELDGELRRAASLQWFDVPQALETTPDGLPIQHVHDRLIEYGTNEIEQAKHTPPAIQFLKGFLNPFVLILLFIDVVMYLTDIQFADEEDKSTVGVITVSIMIIVSVSLRFWQEYRTGREVDALRSLIMTTVTTRRLRNGTIVETETPTIDLVPGDLIRLKTGDVIPADVRIIDNNAIHINQSALTGESRTVKKSNLPDTTPDRSLTDLACMCFMGTSVESGSAGAMVVHTGRRTLLGHVSRSLQGTRTDTAFDIGVRKVSYLLIAFMLVMVPAVFIINGFTKNDWTAAFMFAVAIAVGLTPEMLPLIVTANLAKGAMAMARLKVVCKQLPAIQNLGAMDVLCTDKTGTLTEDKLSVDSSLDPSGRYSHEVLRSAALNSSFERSLHNSLDIAVLERAGTGMIDELKHEFVLIDEIPFDFERRRMGVVVADESGQLMVVKGATDEVLDVCTYVDLDNGTMVLDDATRAAINELINDQNSRGFRVIAVATRNCSEEPGYNYTPLDERDLILQGFLTFMDPPKKTAALALEALRVHNVDVKVITGDNLAVARTVCEKVGMDTTHSLEGSDIDLLDDDALAAYVEETVLFAKVTPQHKARIVQALHRNDRTVGFLGDGINDAPALRLADVGISVDSAADVATESADVLLLEKDLGVLEDGVVEGRRTFANTMKYIKMTASSNFGNVFSMLVASAALPFIPMAPLVVLVQNLTYDLSMLALPWDNVDREFKEQPQQWNTQGLKRFMLQIGPISSIFDITTFALMWFIFKANTDSASDISLFQSGWFIESLISQTLIVHLIRTQRIPFFQSIASKPVLITTGLACCVALVLPFTGFGSSLGLQALPWTYFPWLVITLTTYCLLVQFAKVRFMKRYHSWL